MRDKKNGETRCEMGKKLGEETRDKKKWGDKTEMEKNGETRHETKK